MSRKEEYEWLKAHKICVNCRAADATRGVRCAACADKEVEKKHKKLAAMTEEEREAHKQKNREYLRKRYKEFKEAGKCFDCGKPAYKNQTRCYECRIKGKHARKKYQRSKNKGYAELGKCRICGGEVVAGKKYCEEHLKPYQERMRKYSCTLNKKEERAE